MFPRRLLASLVLLVCIGSSTSALANGRLPNTTFFRINPFDPNQWLLGATFGVLLSNDGGPSFSWLCEQAANGTAGFAGADPAPLWFGPNRLALAAFDNVATTTDGGCTWTPAPAPVFGQVITDLAGHPSDPNTWFVSAVDPNTALSQVYKTSDAGVSYTPLSLTMANVGWQAVRVATADAQRMVAVGYGINDFKGPYLALSTDAGATWSSALVTGGPDGISSPQVVVSPADPNLLLVSVVQLNNNNSVVLRVAADTAVGTVVATLGDGFRGAVFSADGQTVWLATASRVLRSTDAGVTFTPLSAPQNNACVALAGATLYACGNSATDTFALASSADNGSSWQPKFLVPQTQGPLSCPAGTAAQTVCPALWPNTASAIGAKVSSTGDTSGLPTQASGRGNPGGAKQGCSCSGAGVAEAWGLAAAAAYVRSRQRSCQKLSSGV